MYTKMRNVAGISTTEAQKSSDLFMKCQYMDELTGNKGVIFATGTPVIAPYLLQRKADNKPKRRGCYNTLPFFHPTMDKG